jgi:predicted Zn-dependent protease
MEDNTSTPHEELKLVINHITLLNKKGHFLDSYNYALTRWGTIDTWVSIEQKIVAIKLLYNLGGDRSSDAILLYAYRQDSTHKELVDRMLYYYLYKHGPILCYEFLQKKEAELFEDTGEINQFLVFRSILFREFRLFTKAEQYLREAEQKSDKDAWLASVNCRLLLAQDLDDDALILSNANFETTPSPHNLRAYLSVVQKVRNLKAAIAIYKVHIEQYQSCSMWLELASMCATELEWESCEHAIGQYKTLAQFSDKVDQQRLLAFEGQIALYQGKYTKARNILLQHKSIYWQTVCENIDDRQDESESAQINILDVPFYRQEHLTCAPTTIAAIANYWGKPHLSKNIADEICFSGTPDTKERQWLRDNNFHFVEFDLQIQHVYKLIEAGIPFGFVTTNGFTAHLQAVIGYNQHIGTMYIMDPNYSGMQEMLIKQVLESEEYSGGRCLAFVPIEERHKLDGFQSFDPQMYAIWDQYALAKEESNAEAAQLAVEQLNALSATHRLSIKAARDYAVWQRDYAKVQHHNESLLAQFPNQTLLLNSQYFCLRDIGQRNEGLDRLQTYIQDKPDVNLARTLFGEIYDTNERPELAQTLIKILKQYGGYLEDVYYALANYYWDKQQRETATEYYLIAYCLDDTNNAYVESYFKACRFLNQEQSAIDFLTLRYQKYIKRSPLPAISLFRAYDLSNEGHKGIEYLEQALAEHPKDKDLLLMLGRQLVVHGLHNKFSLHRAQFEAVLPAYDYQDLLAQQAIKQGRLNDALPHYALLFAQHPFRQSAADAYFGLLSKMQNIRQIDSQLIALYQEHPNHTNVQDYLISWHSNETLQKEVLQKALSQRPDSSWLRRKLIDKLILLGHKAEALSLAKETAELLKGDVLNHAYLARAHAELGEFETARIIAKEALLRNVDNDIAFDVLIKASVDNEQKKQSLEFVFEQMQSQVVFGDSAWNYWFDAHLLVDRASLFMFVEFVLKNLDHLWYSYAIVSFYHKQLGDLDQAAVYLEQGVAKFPFTPRLHKELGDLYELQDTSDLAITAYQSALEINPGWALVAKQLVEVHEKRGEFEEAINVLVNTIKHTVDDGTLYGYLGDLYLRKEDYDLALNAFTKAVEFHTNYDWAWEKLGQISHIKKQPNLAYKIAETLAQKYPHLGQVWCNWANVTRTPDEKHAHIRKAIKVNPMNQNGYVCLAQYFLNSDEFQQALAVFEDTPWQQHLPFDLLSLQADIYARIGDLEKAVSTIQSILYTESGYSHLWQQLYKWLIILDRKTDTRDACYKQIELNKHDATSLCIAAENLDKFGDGNDKELAKEHVKRAYQLAPNDQYIVLTLVDFQLFDKEYADALQVLGEFKVFSDSEFVSAREIRCLLGLNELEKAKGIFKQLLESPEVDYWCINTPVDAFIQAKKFAEINVLLEHNLATCSEIHAYVWADKSIQVKGFNCYPKLLGKVREIDHDLLTKGVIRALYEAWNDQNQAPDKKVLKEFETIATQNSPVFEQLCLLLNKQGAYQQLIDTFESVINANTDNASDESSTALSMFCFYQVRAAYQLLDKWDEASEVIIQGLQRPSDNTIHNLRLWHYYDVWRKGGLVSQDDLAMLDISELIEMEQYVFATIEVALLIKNQDLESCLEAITPALRRCQRIKQEVGHNPLVLNAQTLLRSRLESIISSNSFFAKMLIKWKLGNRF